MSRAVLGFSPHSGWAAVVALGGDPRAPRVLVRERIEMADPAIAGSKQPYHEAEGRELEEADALLRRCRDRARAMAASGLGRIHERLRREGHAPVRAGILQSSGRQGTSLEAILASHALIHTADGDHFRDALRHAAERRGLEVVGIPARDLPARASDVIGASPRQLSERVAALGRGLGPPWGADQKSAALLAWVLLAEARG